jgi:hypothetical protein
MLKRGPDRNEAAIANQTAEHVANSPHEHDWQGWY